MPRYSLEILLGLAVSSLVIQLAWPTIVAWRHRPRPGLQVTYSHGSEATSSEIQNRGFRSLLYLPVDYDKKGDPWPLLVFLHGSGQRGTDSIGIDVERPSG